MGDYTFTLRSLSVDSVVAAMQVLMSYDFPGTVRELENIIERGVIFCRTDTLSVEDLQVDSAAAVAPEPLPAAADLPFRKAKDRAIQHFHREYIRRVLEQYGGNISRAAEAAGIQRQYPPAAAGGGDRSHRLQTQIRKAAPKARLRRCASSRWRCGVL